MRQPGAGSPAPLASPSAVPMQSIRGQPAPQSPIRTSADGLTVEDDSGPHASRHQASSYQHAVTIGVGAINKSTPAAAAAHAVATATAFEATAWLAVYFFFNLGLTIYNKAVMQFYKFDFPWTLTGIHTLCGAIGCQLLASLGMFKPVRLGLRENLVMLAFSTLYTINIAVSNVSLNMVSVPFHQTVRAMVPLFTMLMEYIMFRKSFTYAVSVTMIPIVFGVSLATIGDYNFTTMGLLLTLLGAVLAALKGIVTNVVQVGKLKLHPLDLLLRMSPLAFIQTMFYAFLTGELRRMSDFMRDDISTPIIFALLANGCIAFGLNLSSFTANKMTSALTMGVAGNVKQVLSIVLSVMIFSIKVSFTNGVGILLTLIGGALYTHVEIKEKQRRAQAAYTKVKTDEES